MLNPTPSTPPPAPTPLPRKQTLDEAVIELIDRLARDGLVITDGASAPVYIRLGREPQEEKTEERTTRSW